MSVKGMITERVRLNPDLAKDMLAVKDGRVHTLVQAGSTMLGIDWDVGVVHKAIEAHGVELAGEVATAMGHGLVVLRPEGGPLFLATEERHGGAGQD